LRWAPRQLLLVREPQPATIEFVLGEGAVRGALGQPEIMAAQLKALNDRARLTNVSIRVVPHRAGMHPALEGGPFTILDFPADEQFGDLPTTVHVVQFGEHRPLQMNSDVERYRECWDGARSAALSQQASLRLLAEIASHHE
jgi:hypothetical protein